MFLLVALVALSGSVQAAVVRGNVYDLELDVLSQAVVEINTVPRQVMVARNGSYEFSVAPGSYIIRARQEKLDLVAVEKLIVRQEGVYVLDLILFPDLGPEEELLNETFEVEEYEEREAGTAFVWVVVIVALLACVAFWFWKRRQRLEKEVKKEPAVIGPAQEAKPAVKADLEQVLAFIKSEGGRTTQKELRKAIPYSEAKISLMLAELESQGRLRKIKKGRGNIIILQ